MILALSAVGGVQLSQPRAKAGAGWTGSPSPVDPAAFGVTIADHTGSMPTFKVGAVRLWNSGTQWSRLQPEGRGAFDWTSLDRMVGAAKHARLPILYTFGSTPAWASSRGPSGLYPSSRTSPPDNIDDWDAFVSAISARYKGRINAYELWNEIGDPRYFSGSVAQMVEMTRRASLIIRAHDPSATVVCPSMGQLWRVEGQVAMHEFAVLHGYDYCDIVGVKLYQRSSANPPETMLDIVDIVASIFDKLGIGPPPIWNTGTTTDPSETPPLNDATKTSYAVRFYLVGLYARYGRTYFDNWGGWDLPITLQTPGSPPTEAALAVETLQNWLSGAEILGCGHGAADGLPGNAYRCLFSFPKGSSGTAAIVWMSTGTATITPEYGGTIHHLDGRIDPINADQQITVSASPILIVNQ